MFLKTRASRLAASALLLFGLTLSSASATTYPDGRVNCTKELLDCYYHAAALLDPWDRFVAGVDCQIQFAGCVRRSILGA